MHQFVKITATKPELRTAAEQQLRDGLGVTRNDVVTLFLSVKQRYGVIL